MANRVYYLDRSGATPQVRIANDRQKVKKYASIVDAQTDLANIGTGEIVATEDGDLNLVNAWIGTQAQYDALTDIPEDTVCFIINNGEGIESPDWANGTTTILSTQSGSTSTGPLIYEYTATEDCFLTATEWVENGGSLQIGLRLMYSIKQDGETTYSEELYERDFYGYGANVHIGPVRLLPGDTIRLNYSAYDNKGYSKKFTVYPLR